MSDAPSDTPIDPAETTDPAPVDPAPVDAPAPETIEQSFELTVSAYGTALKDTLATLETIASQAPGFVTEIEGEIQDLVESTKTKISEFVSSIVADVESLISTV